MTSLESFAHFCFICSGPPLSKRNCELLSSSTWPLGGRPDSLCWTQIGSRLAQVLVILFLFLPFYVQSQCRMCGWFWPRCFLARVCPDVAHEDTFGLDFEVGLDRDWVLESPGHGMYGTFVFSALIPYWLLQVPCTKDVMWPQPVVITFQRAAVNIWAALQLHEREGQRY